MHHAHLLITKRMRVLKKEENNMIESSVITLSKMQPVATPANN